MEFFFVIDILAPRGLIGIEKVLKDYELPLEAWKSGYNGKMVLRSTDGSVMDWNMDAVDSSEMFVQGTIFGDAKFAENQLGSLSKCLIRTGFPHRIECDTPDGDNLVIISHEWHY